jgi:hypothetical protein
MKHQSIGKNFTAAKKRTMDDKATRLIGIPPEGLYKINYWRQRSPFALGNPGDSGLGGVTICHSIAL